MIVALVGRRIDAPAHRPSRFPAHREPEVRSKLRDLLVRIRASVLIASAACGADIIAHEVAGELGLRRVLLLPTDPAKFRTHSVQDRGIGWGPRFDIVLHEVTQQGDVRVLRLDATRESYQRVNETMLDVAQGVAEHMNEEATVLAVAVWEGASYGDDDVTAAFVEEARRRGIRVEEIRTV